MAKNNALISDIPAIKSAVDYSINDYVKTPSTNNTWTSNSNNNPYGLFFDDCSPRFGVERIMFAGLEAIPVEDGQSSDSAGKPGYYLINAKTGRVDKRVRYYGTWNLFSNTSAGTYTMSAVSGDYIVITGVYSKLNMIAPVPGNSGVLSIYLNGTDTTTNLTSFTGSTVIWSQNYATNQVANVAAGISTTNIYTVKLIKDDSGQNYSYGFELVNDQYDATHNVHVPSGTMVIAGEEVSFPAFVGANALNLKGQVNANTGSELYVGTKGARQAWFAKKDPTTNVGAWVAKHTDVEEQVQAAVVEYNGGSDDSLSGLTDSSKYFLNAQGNIVRLKDSIAQDRMLLVPTAAPSATTLTFGKKYDGTAITNVLSNNDQFEDDGVSTCAFTASEAVTVELYGKCLANADFSNSELVGGREIHWREFGAGRSDDFSTLGSSNERRAFTLDDGVTTLKGSNCAASSGVLISGSTAGDYILLTFVGTGLSARTTYLSSTYHQIYVDELAIGCPNVTSPAEVKICSDLPYGSHTVRFHCANSGGNSQFYAFSIYQPKTPVLTGYKPAWTTNLLADQVLTNIIVNSSAGHIDQGSIRKHWGREAVYTNNWTYYTPGSNEFGNVMLATYSSDIGSRLDLTCFCSNKVRFKFYSFGANTTDVLIDDTLMQNEIPSNGYVATTQSVGALGSHKVSWRKGDTSVATIQFFCIEYNTPTYEPQQWKTNPYLDYLVGSNSIGSQLQIGNEKLTDQARSYEVKSTVADSASVSNLPGRLLACLTLDKGNWEVDLDCTVYRNLAGGVVGSELYIAIDGVALPHNVGDTPQFSITNVQGKHYISLSKKSAVTLFIASNGGGYQQYVTSTGGTWNPASIKARKISN